MLSRRTNGELYLKFVYLKRPFQSEGKAGCACGALALLLWFSACDTGSSPSNQPEPPLITKINFSGTETVKNIILSGLTGQNVYLVKVNKSDSVVDADNTGHVFTASSSQRSVTDVSFPTESLLPSGEQTRPVSGVFITGTGETLTRYDHPVAQTFNRNPPPIAGIARQSAQAAKSVLERAATYTVGTSTKQFWVEDASSAWIEIDATLCADGNHSNIWVADVNFDNSSAAATDNKITGVQARALAAKFDAIYGFETPECHYISIPRKGAYGVAFGVRFCYARQFGNPAIRRRLAGHNRFPGNHGAKTEQSGYRDVFDGAVE
jgi:hypothetical protein